MDRIFFNKSDENNDYDSDNDIDETNSNFRNILINNCIKYLPNIQTNDILLLNSLNLQKNIFKSIELIIPLENPNNYYNIKKLEGFLDLKL